MAADRVQTLDLQTIGPKTDEDEQAAISSCSHGQSSLLLSGVVEERGRSEERPWAGIMEEEEEVSRVEDEEVKWVVEKVSAKVCLDYSLFYPIFFSYSQF